MKNKILSLLLIICCCFCFCGCSNQLKGEYWVDVSAKIAEVVESTKHQELIKFEYNAYMSAITQKEEVESKKAYSEVNYLYDTLLSASLFATNNYYNLFNLTPNHKTKKFNNKMSKVLKNLEAYEKALNNFEEQKREYLLHVDYTELTEAYDDAEIRRLTDFKENYSVLIKKAYNLSESVYEAYLEGYNNFDNFENYANAENLSEDELMLDRKIALNGANLVLIKNSLNLLSLYEYNVVDEQAVKSIGSFCHFYEEIVKNNYDKAISNATEIAQNLIVWKSVYDQFIQDSKKYNKILNKIDLVLLKDSNYDADSYAEKVNNVKSASEINYFLDFYKNVDVLYNYSLDI